MIPVQTNKASDKQKNVLNAPNEALHFCFNFSKCWEEHCHVLFSHKL